MSAEWVFCECCGTCNASMVDQPDGGALAAGVFNWSRVRINLEFGDPPPTHPCEPFSCACAVFRLKFPTAQEALFFTGESELEPEYLLFHDGSGTFSRDASRSVPLEVDVADFEYVGGSTSEYRFLVPIRVTLNSTFIWERKAGSPVWNGTNWGDFEQWRLIAGTDPPVAGEPGEDPVWCVGMGFSPFMVGRVAENTSDLNATFAGAGADARCLVVNGSVCTTYVPPGIGTDVIDGWNVGGNWSGSVTGLGAPTPCNVGMVVNGARSASVQFPRSSLQGLWTEEMPCEIASVTLTAGCGLAAFSCTWVLTCASGGDPRNMPNAGDYSLDACAGAAICDPITFNTLATGC